MLATTTKIDAEKVISVYSGRPGCACGCRGKHTYATRVAEEMSKRRGYPVNTSDNTVYLIVGKMNALLAEGLGRTDEDGHFVSVETETRLYIAYYKD